MFRLLVVAMCMALASAFSGPATLAVSPVARASSVQMIGKKFGKPKKVAPKKEKEKSFMEQASVSTAAIVNSHHT